jgi:uncharacterized protein with HEPN domain
MRNALVHAYVNIDWDALWLVSAPIRNCSDLAGMNM